MTLQPRDRVLLLDGADAEAAARAVTEGTVVVLASGDALYELRRRLAAHENVMVTPGDRAQIPWQNAYFTLIVDPTGEPPTPEILRVLDPLTGRILQRLDE